MKNHVFPSLVAREGQLGTVAVLPKSVGETILIYFIFIKKLPRDCCRNLSPEMKKKLEVRPLLSLILAPRMSLQK